MAELAPLHPMAVADVAADVWDERARQDQTWGEQNHDRFTWLAILAEEVGEAAQAALDSRFKPATALGVAESLRRELVQVAAVAQAIIECGDRNRWWPK